MSEEARVVHHQVWALACCQPPTHHSLVHDARGWAVRGAGGVGVGVWRRWRLLRRLPRLLLRTFEAEMALEKWYPKMEEKLWRTQEQRKAR